MKQTLPTQLVRIFLFGLILQVTAGLSFIVRAQSNPNPFDLSSGTFTFSAWGATSSAGTFPANMVFPTTTSAAATTATSAAGDYGCPYNLTARARVNGRDNNGVSFLNTSSGQNATCNGTGTSYGLGALLALNTQNRSAITVSWTAATIAAGDGTPTSRSWGLQLQYRIGITGAFTNVADGLYQSAATGDAQNLGPIKLPASLENQPIVQLRWVYHEIAANSGGSRPELRLDDVSVSSQPLAVPQPDLTISLSGPASATVNQPFNYSLVINNVGSASASGILAQFSLPAAGSVTYNSATSAGDFTASQSGGIVSFANGSLSAGTSTTLTVSVTPTITGTITSGTALVDPSNTIAESDGTNNSAPGITVNSVAAAASLIRITEYAYDGLGIGGEFIELTNIGNSPVDLTGWSFDDNSRVAGSFPIGALGTLNAGESAIISEAAEAAFRTAWYLPATVKVIGGNNQNLGRSDEMNIYDGSGTLIDRLTYNDQGTNPAGTIRTQNSSGWTTPANLGTNTIANWQLSAVNDAQHSYSSVSGNVGNPGGYNIPLNRVLVRESGNSTTVTEGGASDTYTVVLNSQPTADVTITITPGSQLTANVTSLVFTPANYAVTQTVSISAVDDAVVEGTHAGTITHIAASTDPVYNGIAVNPVSVTIIDNDVAAGAQPTLVVASTTTPYLSASAVSGVIGDPTDPASTLGIDFTINDTDTPVSSLSISASSSNSSVVPVANLALTGSAGNYTLKITPAGVGYSTITVAVTDGSNVTSYSIRYAASAASTTTSRFHTGASDASTAVDAGGGYMLVADDENQVLRLYNRQNSGLPLAGFDYTSSLGLTDISGGVPREVDIESSVRVGNRIYWLGSHSNASGGNDRPNRSRLFATDVTGSGAATNLSYVGRYDGLKNDLINWDVNNGHGLGANYFGFQASAAPGIAPEETGGAGFNIEGLTIAPDGATGYVSFRAPISPASNRTKALIVPVTNFTSLVSGNPTGGTAAFGAPILLDLGGRGIREIKGNGNGQYLIVAGPSGGAGADPNAFKLYTWTGKPSDMAILRAADLSGLSGTSGSSSIESIVELPATLDDNSSIQFLMDNGDAVFYGDNVIAKELLQNNFKKSRSDYATLGASLGQTLVASPASLTSFVTMAGMASTAQLYTLTGSNLVASIAVTAPARFEVSTDGITFSQSVTVPQTSGVVSQTIAIRLANSSVVGPVNGAVTNVSGSATASVTVSGTVNAALPNLTPSQLFSSSQIEPGQTVDMLVAIRNVSTSPTLGDVKFFVTNYTPATGLTLTLNTDPTVNIGGTTYTLNTADFAVTPTDFTYTFTSVAGSAGVVSGNSSKLVAFKLTRAATSSKGSVTNTITIQDGTGGGDSTTTDNSISNVVVKP